MIVKMLAAAVALAAMTASARADVSHLFFIRATDFKLDSGPGGEPPREPVAAGIFVTFDPSTSIDATTSGLSTLFSPFKTEFAYDSLDDTLVFGTDVSQVSCGVEANTWCAFVGHGSQAFPVLQSLSVTSDDGGVWIAQQTTLITLLATAVPEPSAWTLTLIGFGGMALALRRRRGARLGGDSPRPI